MNLLRLFRRPDPVELCARADAQLPGATRALECLDHALDLIADAEATSWRPLASTPAGAALVEVAPELDAIATELASDVRGLLEGFPIEGDPEPAARGLAGRVARLVESLDE
jgi:hypothetical protein